MTIEYFSEATEALAQLQAGAGTIAMLPQPFVTSALSQVEGLRVALDMNTEWEAVAGSKLVTGVLVARTDAIEANPEAFSAFLTAYETSTELANSDLEGTAALCEEYGIVAKAALAQKALPECNIVFETGSEMKTDLATYFQVLYDADPASVGGAMPDDAFYYGRRAKPKRWQTAAAILFWCGRLQLLAMALGHGGLFLATPSQTVQALAAQLPTTEFWRRIVFSSLRILTGFLLAVAVGLLLGAAGGRWQWGAGSDRPAAAAESARCRLRAL